MDNENEEEATEEDIEAGAAYIKVTTQESLNKNSNDDNEFDYDENLFDSTSSCEKSVKNGEKEKLVKNGEKEKFVRNGEKEKLVNNGEKDHTGDGHVMDESKGHVNNGFIEININVGSTSGGNTEDCHGESCMSNASSDTQEASQSADTTCSVVIAQSNLSCEVPAVEACAESSDLNLPCDTSKETCEDTSSAGVIDWRKEHEAASEEWRHVGENVIGHEASTVDAPCVSSEPVYFSEAVEHFQLLNLSEYREKIKPCIQRTGIAAFCHSLIGPASLSKVLIPERDFIFTIALLKFDNNDEVCTRILYTIYKGLTKIKVNPPRYGGHWENIGFQGNDPTTDLRGCGMLGLLTTLHFITSVKTSTLGALVYHLSQDEMQHFPFCVMSINVTRISLQILREGKLNKECNKRYKAAKQSNYQIGDNTGIVYDVFQEVFVSIFNRIYLTWKNEYKTMADSGFVMHDVETYAKKKPLELMRQLKKEKTPSCDEKIEKFVGIDEL